MRLRSRVAAAAAVLLLLAVAPAGASASKHSNAPGTCKVNINAAPRLLEAGETVSVFGRLACAVKAGATSRLVTLLALVGGSHGGFKPIETTTTDANGFYELTTPPAVNNSIYFVRSRGAASGRRAVKVYAHVAFNGPPEGTTLLTGPAHKVTFTGTVSPADAGARVVLQRQNAIGGNEWHRIGRGVVGPEGSYSITHTFVVPGDANLRVLVRSGAANIPSPSDVMTYEISQAQNPALTIDGLPDPITFGQSVVISGVLAGAPPSTPLTLLAHTARQHGFAPIDETKTTTGGAYTFSAQKPVASTFYAVTGGGQRSAIVYEGVHDLLMASPSPTTVIAGQPFTVSGTVAPDHTGHVIYLQQLDRSGSGFHTVEVTAVGAGSAYTISHAVYTPGTYQFRVRIPGGPEDEGAASTPFAITVTPAPPAALAPERSSNVGLPPEGEV